MQKIMILFVMLLALTGCVRKLPVEQGNVMTPDMVSQLHTGMSEAEVIKIMGSPMALNTFRENRVDYVYTYKPGRGTTNEKHLTLIFENDRLREIKGNIQ